MSVFVRPLPGTASPEQVLRRLGARARRRGLPSPAALTGDWFGGGAVLAPTVRVAPVPPERALTTLDDPAVFVGANGAVGGGWIGYLAYGLADPGSRPARMPSAAWGWADHVLRRDAGQRWWFEALCDRERAEALCAELGDFVAETEEPRPEWVSGPVTGPDAEDHHKAVSGCVDAIKAGEIFQANICTRFSIPFDGSPLELFSVGSERLHPARAAYVAGGWGAVLSLSPELFLERRGNVVRSRPIKGTLPRRGVRDDSNAERLRASTKDIAENIMIVDMARNDLGQVAVTGTVTVPDLLKVQPHPGVWHLVSEVRAELPPGAPASALLAATFPPASVTGAPKSRALEIIREQEPLPREVYCGAVGMCSPAAGMELNVAIRTLEYADGLLRLGAGGGITADSDPESEWQECLTKIEPLLGLLAPERHSRAASTAS